jgi:hypothetical protein
MRARPPLAATEGRSRAGCVVVWGSETGMGCGWGRGIRKGGGGGEIEKGGGSDWIRRGGGRGQRD